MLSELEQRQWAEIEQRLRRDPRLTVPARFLASRRTRRWRVLELAGTVLLGGWLVALVLSLWCHLEIAFTVAGVFTVVLALIVWMFSRIRR